MKKLLSIVCCAVVLLSVSSCTKQYVSPVVNQNKTIIKDITSADWSLSTATGVVAYQASLDVPIDVESAKYDGVIVSISYDGGNTYEQLPEVYGNISYSYTYNSGNITLYAQTPDGATAVQPTDPIKVKIVVVFSNP